APQRRWPGREPLTRDGGAQEIPVVDGVERPEAGAAGADRLERVLGRADATGKGDGCHGGSSFVSLDTSVRVWHRGPIGAGCRGVTGPVPQPLSMWSGTCPAPLRSVSGDGARSRLAPEDVPGEADVVLGRPRVADREPEHEAAVEARVGEEHRPGRVDPFEQRFVLLVGALQPEADEREMPRRAELPARLRLHPGLERLRETDVFADDRLQPLAPVTAEDRPELERAKASAERHRVLAQAHDVLAHAQVLGYEAERVAEIVGASRPERGAV